MLCRRRYGLKELDARRDTLVMVATDANVITKGIGSRREKEGGRAGGGPW